jgi:ATP-binding cassette subfamily B protein
VKEKFLKNNSLSDQDHKTSVIHSDLNPDPLGNICQMNFIVTYIRAFRQIGSEKKVAITLVVANLILALSQFAVPVLFGRVIDHLAKPGIPDAPIMDQALVNLVIAWIGFGLFTIVASVLVALHADRLSHRSRLAMIAAFFEHALTLPLAFHNRSHSGQLLKVALEGANGMAWIWLNILREHCASIILLVLLLPATLFINWRLGIMLVVLLMLFSGLTALVMHRTEKLQGEVEQFHTGLAAHASDAFGNLPIIQSFTRIERETAALRDIIHKLLAAQTPVLVWWAFAQMIARAAATLTMLGILIYGIILNRSGLASVGDIVSFINLAILLIGRMETLVGFINHMMTQVPKLRAFFDILDLVPTVRDQPGATELTQIQGDVIFENVSFSYDGKAPAIRHLNFTAKAGQCIALVGATGSGKSTTLSLLYRAFDPQSGRILIDGHDIRTLTLNSLRRHIGVVFQESMLFARSIADNIRVGRPDASDDDVLAALEKAQGVGIITREPEGLHALIGERGRTLSGGERQRLAIARALLKNPPILILDEATSALDAATEHAVRLALDVVMKNRTTFVIAHRFSTIRNADLILVFENGQIIERGTYSELIAQKGKFAALAEAQILHSEPGAEDAGPIQPAVSGSAP